MGDLGKFVYSNKVLDLDITGGLEFEEWQIAGQRITYNEGTVQMQIKLNTNSNDIILLEPKDILRVPEGFDRIYIKFAASPQTVRVVVSSPWNMAIDSNQVSVTSIGEVTTISEVDKINKDYYTENALAFRSGLSIPPVASNYITFGLHNPAASGVILRVDSFSAGTVENGTAIKDYVMHSLTGIPTGLSTKFGVNNLLGSPASLGVVYHGNSTTQQGSLIEDILMFQGGRPNPVKIFTDPVLIPEGETLLIISDIVAIAGIINMSWREG